MPEDLQKVLVVGLGKVTGAAVSEALLRLGRKVRLAEKNKTAHAEQAAAGLARRGVEVIFDDSDPSLAAWADLVVPSPGVPPSNHLLRAACDRNIPIWSEIEIGWRLAKGPVMAITGTNGKTTSTELLTSILKAGSLSATSAGNIGVPLVEAAGLQGASTVLVTEVSSFQLAYIDQFRPCVAVVLNVADDHYDWHGSAQNYLAAKARITENQQPGDLLLVSASDAGALSIAARSRADLGVFGMESPSALKKRVETELGRPLALSAGIAEEKVVMSSAQGDVSVMESSDIRLAGRHNLENVLAAAAAAFHYKCGAGSIRKGVSEFRSLPHRMNVIAQKNGVKFIDDSKATNPHAALAALTGLENVILIAGGRSKGISLKPFEEATQACKGAVVMGESAAELKEVLGRLPVHEAATIEEAVRQAARMAAPGDTVLLSPGCSSLDQYSSYAERGDRFVNAVAELR